MAMNRPGRFRWKRAGPRHFIAAGILFGSLYFPLDQLPGEESGGLALLPALLFYMSSPRTRREWLLAVLAALATTAAALAGMLAGYGIAGIWPPKALEIGSDAHQLVGAFIALTAAPVGFTATHALAREPLPANDSVERTLADAESWHGGLLALASFAALFAVMFYERAFRDGPLPVVPPGFGLLAFLIFLSSGSILVTAWANVGARKVALLARFGLSLLIGIVGYAVYGGVYFEFEGEQPGLAVFIAMTAVHAAAPALGWWQIKRFVRHEGMLR